jgi:hypothetical protein
MMMMIIRTEVLRKIQKMHFKVQVSEGKRFSRDAIYYKGDVTNINDRVPH